MEAKELPKRVQRYIEFLERQLDIERRKNDKGYWIYGINTVLNNALFKVTPLSSGVDINVGGRWVGHEDMLDLVNKSTKQVKKDLENLINLDDPEEGK